MMKQNKDIFIAPSQAARILNVSVSTLKKFIYTGKIKTLRTPGGHHRILERDLFQMLEEPRRVKGPCILDDKTLFEIAEGLVGAIEKKHRYCKGHASGVAQVSLSMGIALRLNPFQMRKLHLAALLHDVGMMTLDSEVVNKEGALSAKEFASIKTHPVEGEAIANSIEHFKSVAGIIRQHHERYDGSGYPDALSADEISQEARIIHIAESFIAMTAQDSYKAALSRQEAFAQIEKGSGSSFDPYLTGVFFETHEQVS